MSLDAATIDLIASRTADLVVARLSQPKPAGEVMSAEEAAAYVGKRNARSFRRWKQRLGVRGCGINRYSKQTLDAALKREARAIHFRRKQPATLVAA
jgi:hypothetical protein